ncbi:MAG: DUF4912 domain-containing protein [Treponema sp.]|jgi:hypothetical protein|nr:DUF4912 domain-containing protein [Treponema sp.]
MDDPLVTRSYLESLSTGELTRMADRSGLDIPPGLDRIFIIEELLDLAAEDREDEEPLETAPVTADVPEPAAIPKQYNITFIEAMIRDPLWVFVFWEVKGADREVFENSPDFDGYYLKVSPLGRAEPVVRERISPEDAEKEGVFIVPVGTEDTAWYLGFPSADRSHEGGNMNRQCKVEICAGYGGEEILLAASKPFRFPELLDFPRRNRDPGGYGNPLICLSGAGDFHILRNGDRQSRDKKRDYSAAG